MKLNVTRKNAPSIHIDEKILNVSLDMKFNKVLISLDTTYIILTFAELGYINSTMYNECEKV